MARPMRSRRPPLKFSEDENILDTKSRNTKNKIVEVNTDNKETLNDATKTVASKSKSAKGNLIAGKKIVTQIPRSPVLRDRTNLPAEPFKVDILMKKGTDDKTMKKTAKTVRQTAKPMASEENESEVPTRAKRLRQTKAKDPQPTEEITANLPRPKENTRKVVAENENTENESPGKENAQDLPLANKKQKKNEAPKEKAKNLPVKQTSKKSKPTKDASASANEDDSLVVESENVADSQNTPKERSVKGVPRKIGKRVAFSNLSLSQQSDKNIENRKKKSLRRSSVLQKKGKEDSTTSDAKAGKKFFKSKGACIDTERILPGKKVATIKRRKVERPRVSTSFRLRQTTLSESFAKHATKKNLRPRVAKKNYHEQSTIGDKTAVTDKDETKGPVYKTAKLLEKSDDDGSEIYEFHFDSNDSREKIAKKKKKKLVRNVVTKKRTKGASGTKKTISKPKVVAKNAVKENKGEEPQPKLPAATDEPMDTNDVPAIIMDDYVDMSPIPGMAEKVKKQPNKLEPQPERVESLKAKPIVVESLNLTGETKINLTSTPQLTKSSEKNTRPLRTTNAFNLPRPSSQYRTMLSHALLNKSLSPIKKALENFDPGSPWRPPAIIGQQFSRVKNVVQSTPHIRKFSTMLESNRNSLEPNAEPAIAKMNKIAEQDEKSANVEKINNKALIQMNKIATKDEKSANVEKANIKVLAQVHKIPTKDEKSTNVEKPNIEPQKVLGLAKSPRKFGTVISNVNLAIPSANSIAVRENNEKSELNRGSPRKIPTVAPPQLVELSVSRISDGNNAGDDFDDHADKENSMPVFTSPKKSLKSPKKLVPKQSPLRPFNHAKISTKENWEPQPGPSGLQKRSPLGESRILRQSNLNNFLNIDQVPTSTRISAAHGIFADAHSTPIPGKPVKVITTEANVENAFGFDDIGDSNIDLSPIKSGLFVDPAVAKVAKGIVERRIKIEEKKAVTVPSRFSIGEIKKHLHPVVSKDKAKIDSVERIEKNKDDNREKREEKAENEKGDDAVTFSDTFDVLTAAAEANDKENVQEVPLFADLEPVHFKQPPRHSYKRKRIVAFNFSEDEEDNEEREIHNRHEGTKKRKISKVEKERQKKMEEWAKNLNNTFEEIDHFDLLVE